MFGWVCARYVKLSSIWLFIFACLTHGERMVSRSFDGKDEIRVDSFRELLNVRLACSQKRCYSYLKVRIVRKVRGRWTRESYPRQRSQRAMDPQKREVSDRPVI